MTVCEILKPSPPAVRAASVALLLLASCAALGGPWVEVGNSGLRSDIQILADAGVIRGAVTTWPLAWGDIVDDLEYSGHELTDYEAAALARVRAAARRQTRTGRWTPRLRLAAAEKPVQIRSFENTPREELEAQVGASWVGRRFAARLQATVVSDPDDDKSVRADGSYAAVALGNWSLGLSAQDRWWGPGWQSSLIYSNNARPIPSVTLERISTTPFENRWLAWLGPWDLVVQVGMLEHDRYVPDTAFFGMRFNFRPLESLEIGISRTAQLCGQGRPCDLGTWKDMFVGNDNRGDNVATEDEPGNQLGGFDARWSHRTFGQPFALYGQLIGEDEGNRLPQKFIGQLGTETWGQWNDVGTYRLWFEWSDTICNFPLLKGDTGSGSDENCTYNHPIYRTGYRFHGRSIGHTADNDASLFTLGGILTDNRNHDWRLRLGYGNLNRIGPPDDANTVARVKTRYREVELGHRRRTPFGDLNLGVGYEVRRNTVTGETDEDARVFLEWIWTVW